MDCLTFDVTTKKVKVKSNQMTHALTLGGHTRIQHCHACVAN